jgi:hypothetical protein
MSGARTMTVGVAVALGMVLGGGVSASAQQVDAATLLATLEPQLTIELKGAVEGEVEGAAVLKSAGDRTEVTLALSGAPADAELTGYLVAGRCEEQGSIILQLGEFEIDADGRGQLETELPLNLTSIAESTVSVSVGAPEARALACGAHVPSPTAETAPEAAPAQTPAADLIPLPDLMP